MSLIDTLETYYNDRDDFGNLKTHGTPEDPEDEFEGLDDEPIDFDDGFGKEDDEELEELDDVIIDDLGHYHREKEMEED